MFFQLLVRERSLSRDLGGFRDDLNMLDNLYFVNGYYDIVLIYIVEEY